MSVDGRALFFSGRQNTTSQKWEIKAQITERTLHTGFTIFVHKISSR